MKRLLVLVGILLLTVSFGKPNIPNPTTNFFVNDFAGVIEESDEEQIFHIAKSLYESSGNRVKVVVVTVESLGGYSIEEYADELFDNWKIGNSDKNYGVLLLLSVNDRKSRIKFGYGLEGILTDSSTGKIQDEYMVPYYKENNFSQGLLYGTEAVSKVINEKIVLLDESIIEKVIIFGFFVIFILVIFDEKVGNVFWYKIVTGKKSQKIYDKEFKYKRKKIHIAEKNKAIKVCAECGESKFIRCVKGKYLYSKCKNCKQCYQQISKAYVMSRSNYYGGECISDYSTGSYDGIGSSGDGGSSRSF